MHHVSWLLLSASCLALAAPARGEPLVYEGDAGPGKGKHLVFIASDHEYRSEETLPALARILAKRHGFRCTVVFGVDDDGVIAPGHNNVPGIEALDTADGLVIFTRFQNWPDEQMRHLDAYVRRGGPVVGLRTATHGFQLPATSPFARYSNSYDRADYKDGFGRQVLGEKWVGHYGANGRSSTRLDIVSEQAGHPILRGVHDAWVRCAGYKADPAPPCDVLALAQPLDGMKPTSPADATRPPVPGAWTRTYRGDAGQTGRVFTTTYGASNDLENEGFRRMLVNACFWAAGLEAAITPDLDVAFVGPFNPTWLGGRGSRRPGTKPADLAGWDTPIVPLK